MLAIKLQRRLLTLVSTAFASAQPQTAKKQLDELYSFLKLKCASPEKGTLESYTYFVETAARHLNITHHQTTHPFRYIKRKTLLKSRFVHKDHRVQYETREYYSHIEFKNLTGSTADTLLEYVQRNMPETVFMIVERHKLGTVDFLNDESTNNDKSEEVAKKEDDDKSNMTNSNSNGNAEQKIKT